MPEVGTGQYISLHCALLHCKAECTVAEDALWSILEYPAGWIFLWYQFMYWYQYWYAVLAYFFPRFINQMKDGTLPPPGSFVFQL